MSHSSSHLPEPAGSDSRAARSVQLDILRGVAILLVLGRHHVVGAADAGLLLPFAGVWQRFGWAGVDLFFVLSGFLIGGLLFEEVKRHGTLDVRRFMLRRGMRIWPAYYVYLLFLALPFQFQPLVVSPFEDPFDLTPSVLHYQNYGGMPRSHLWSLSVEEHVYLVLPLLVVAGVKLRRPRWIPWVVAASLLAALIGRVLTPMLLPFPWRSHVYPTHLRFDSIMFGALLAYAHAFSEPLRLWAQRRARQLVIAGILLSAPLALVKLETSWWMNTFGFTVAYFAFGMIVFGFIHLPMPAPDSPSPVGRCVCQLARGMAAVGFYSYAIYLWHYDAAKLPVDHLIANGFLQGWPSELRFLLATAAYILLAVTAGLIATKLVDLPILRLRDRLFPARATVSVTADAWRDAGRERLSRRPVPAEEVPA